MTKHTAEWLDSSKGLTVVTVSLSSSKSIKNKTSVRTELCECVLQDFFCSGFLWWYSQPLKSTYSGLPGVFIQNVQCIMYSSVWYIGCLWPIDKLRFGPLWNTPFLYLGQTVDLTYFSSIQKGVPDPYWFQLREPWFKGLKLQCGVLCKGPHQEVEALLPVVCMQLTMVLWASHFTSLNFDYYSCEMIGLGRVISLVLFICKITWPRSHKQSLSFYPL